MCFYDKEYLFGCLLTWCQDGWSKKKKKKCTIPQSATLEKYIHRPKKNGTVWELKKDAEIWDVGRKRVRASTGEEGVNQRDRDVPPQDNAQNTSSGEGRRLFLIDFGYFSPFLQKSISASGFMPPWKEAG